MKFCFHHKILSSQLNIILWTYLQLKFTVLIIPTQVDKQMEDEMQFLFTFARWISQIFFQSLWLMSGRLSVFHQKVFEALLAMLYNWDM